MHSAAIQLRPRGLDALLPGAALGVAMAIAAAATPAHAQGVVLVQPPRVVVTPGAPEIVAPYAPPALRTEVVPTAPDDSVIWHPGHWTWDNGAWAWDAGHYVARPRRTAMWEPGHWVGRPDGGYVWSEGHWD